MAYYPPIRDSGDAALARLRMPRRPVVRRPVAPPIQRTVAAPQAAPTFNAPDPLNPSLQQQAAQMVSQQIDPILQQITGLYGARSSAVTSAIGGVTNQYAAAQGALGNQMAANFGPAIDTVKGTATGLRDELTGLGKSQYNVQNAALAQAGLPQGAGGADINIKSLGKGAGGAAYAIGKAMIEALQAEQATAENLASQLPGFAQGEGQQATSQALSQLRAEMINQLSEQTARAPSLYYSIYQDLYGQQRDEATTAYNRALDQRDWNYKVAHDRAGIVGPQAPTTAGRIAYWTDVADQRTKTDPNGYVYFANPKGIGISVRRDPRTNRPIVDPAFTAAVQAGVIKRQDTATRTRLSSTITVGSDKAGRYLVDKLTGAKVLIQPPIKPGTPKPSAPVKFKGTDGRTWIWDPKNPGAAHPIPGQPGPKVKPGAPKYGTAPRRVGNGQWVTKTGRPLTKGAASVWEKKFQDGFTDGMGHMLPGKPKKKGTSPSGTDPTSPGFYTGQ